MSFRSTCPAAMAAMVVLFAQIPLDGEVRDGPQIGDSAAREVIAVGYTEASDDTTGESQQMISADLSAQMQENYQIHCAVAVLIGDEDVAPTRQRAFDLLGACADKLAGSRNLGGTVANVELDSWTLREDESTGGMYCRIRFDVRLTGFTGN